MCSCARDLKETVLPNIGDFRNGSRVACTGLSHFFAKKVVACGKERVKQSFIDETLTKNNQSTPQKISAMEKKNGKSGSKNPTTTKK